ncbi:hypothetical protein NHX12_007250 [Muraenolepis orangiensis]|uniref:A-kinase anchor protein 11 n=1 Tax=Muraenolepis orangiensis TaxID=630683 RepID=A0A9Q0ICT8_9TELE|nr:hypothetical protein NHX12_007250 [Muraenolepis orangiensis]
MDACARIRGVPLRTRASIRKETVRDGGTQCVKSLLRVKKELCRVSVELQRGDALRLTQIHFVCLPGPCEGKDVSTQTLPAELCDLLRPLAVHSLRNDEVLLFKDSRRPAEGKDPGSQCWLRVVCVLRHSLSSGPCPQTIMASLLGLLGRYAAGIRYALELQALHKGTTESNQAEEDDINQSVSSIEDDFVTALEHLEEEDTRESSSAAAPYYHGTKRDVASQTVPAHKRRKDLTGSRVIISSSAKRPTARHESGSEVSITVQRPSATESQWTHYNPGTRLPVTSTHFSDSEDSDGSSPSPIIFLDEVGYQKSLLAKLDIPQVPGGPRDPVEDSDSEVSEFFDSFDQFDDVDELSSDSCTLTLPLDLVNTSNQGQKKKPPETTVGGSKYVSRGCSTKCRNLQSFDQPPLPANVKKPTPLKPGSPYSPNSEVPDSPRPVRTSCEENGGPLFSPVSSSAFSPLGDSGGPFEYFWKSEGDVSELRKPQDLCSLYKTYSDFASSLSREILGSVCGYQSPVDISDNKNLSCVCHKEFQNPSGHLMKLSEIQEAVTMDKLQQRPQSLKDGIQRFATDLVEMSLGSALRDLQKGVSQCTTTLCHLAARLTSSVFQMAFHEIGMRRAYVLKERAISGLAGFLVGEAVSGALKEFLLVKKQIFHNTVSHFAADLAEELVFEGIMEVYLSESVIQEAFIQLSQADVAFTSQAAISVSLDNVCYVSSEDTSTHTCTTFTETCQYKTALAHTSQTSPKRTVVTTTSWDATAATQTEQYPEGPPTHSHQGDASEGKPPFHHFSGNMVDMIQPSEVSKEKQIRQFSKKLKGKLAKEFSPATPPPTPHYQPEPGPGPTEPSPEADKADFMVKLMRSLMSNKEAFHYAERLACHIISMATEMDTLIGAQKEENEEEKDGSRNPGGEVRRDSVAQFSVDTLNTLWVYAGEVAGEVIGEVKRMVNSEQKCPHHRSLRRRSLDRLVPEYHHHPMALGPHHPISTTTSSPGLSSQFPSCESVTDEYAGYLIRVLKKEGGSRELVLDQYASRLAYRSIKQGLTHAARKMKLKSSTANQLHSSRSLPEDWKAAGDEASPPGEEAGAGESSMCTCPRDSEEQRHRDYTDLVNFAESLAYNITYDVTQKLCLSPSLLPKSLTDSCLYRKSKLEDMAENLIRGAFSCPLLGKEVKGRQYHSLGSLSEGGYGSGVMQVIEHYARKIVEDTLEMGLFTAGHVIREPPAHDRHAHTDRLSEGTALGDTTCCHCQVQACPHCTKLRVHHHRQAGPRIRPGRGQEYEGRAEHLSSSLEIPKIQIDLDLRVAFAEEMVSVAMETAKRELSNTSLNADSGIGHDGASYAESLTAEIVTSALSNLCQAVNLSSPGRDATESTMSQQLSVGDDSLGSWSNLSFEDEHPDENSSFLHLSDSNGNSSSWSSLGLEGETCEDHLSFSPSDSDCTEDKETERRCARTSRRLPRPCWELGHEPQGGVTLEPQVRCLLQWAAASMAELPQVQLGTDGELQQLQAVVHRLRERDCRVGELLQAVLRYCEEVQGQAPALQPREMPSPPHQATPLFQWLLEHF